MADTPLKTVIVKKKDDPSYRKDYVIPPSETSPNLFSLSGKTINGVTLTVNSDGSLVFNGTATSTINFAMSDPIPAGTYSAKLQLDLNPNGYISAITTISLRTRDTTIGNTTGTSNTTRWLNSANQTDFGVVYESAKYVALTITSGTELTNYTVKVQIESGSTLSGYAPYGFTAIDKTARANIPSSTRDISNDTDYVPSQIAEYNAVEMILQNGYTEQSISWKPSSNYPTGWRSGYISGEIGDENWSTGGASNYLRAYFAINTTNYPEFSNVKAIKITPPTGFGIRIYEKGSNGIERIVGKADSRTFPEYMDVPLVIFVDSAKSYALLIGKTYDGSAATKAADSDFVATIGLSFYYNADSLALRGKYVKILGIGNSWCRDVCRHLWSILNDAGCKAKVVQAYLGGSALHDQYFGMLNDTYAYLHDSASQIVHSTYQSWTYTDSDTPVKDPSSGYNNGAAGIGVTLESIIESDTWDYILIMPSRGYAGRIESLYSSDLSTTVNIEDHISSDSSEWDNIGDTRTWDLEKFVEKILRHCSGTPDIRYCVPYSIAEHSTAATWASAITAYNNDVTPTTDAEWHELYEKVHRLFQEYGEKATAYLGNICNGLVNPGLAIYYARKSPTLSGIAFELQRSSTDTHLADGLPKYIAGYAIAAGLFNISYNDVSYYPTSGQDNNMSDGDVVTQQITSTPSAGLAALCRMAGVSGAKLNSFT